MSSKKSDTLEKTIGYRIGNSALDKVREMGRNYEIKGKSYDARYYTALLVALGIGTVSYVEGSAEAYLREKITELRKPKYTISHECSDD